MQPKKRREPFATGVTVSFSPSFVKNIHCVGTDGDLFSLLNPNYGQSQILHSDVDAKLDLTINTNPKFVAAVAYPNYDDARDPLVTEQLLNLTSYERHNIKDNHDEEDFERERDLHSTVLNDPSHENRMSFDDLGQIYTNISRKRILSKVQKKD